MSLPKMEPLLPNLADVLTLQLGKAERGITAWKFGQRPHPILKEPACSKCSHAFKDADQKCPLCGTPRGPKRQFHSGVDLPDPWQTPITPPWPGTVLKAYYDPNPPEGFGGGNSLVLAHSIDGVEMRTGYAHLAGYVEQTKWKGAAVGPGAPVAYVGSTGVSSGPHLHFTLRVKMGGKFVLMDPLPYLLQAAGIAEYPLHAAGIEPDDEP